MFEIRNDAPVPEAYQAPSIYPFRKLKVGDSFIIPDGKVAAVKKAAGGGPVNSGAPYLVGERGPELFVPSMAGQVVPSYAMSGTSTVNNYNIQAIDVKSFEERIMGSNRAVWAANAYAQKSLSPRGRT